MAGFDPFTSYNQTQVLPIILTEEFSYTYQIDDPFLDCMQNFANLLQHLTNRLLTLNTQPTSLTKITRNCYEPGLLRNRRLKVP